MKVLQMSSHGVLIGPQLDKARCAYHKVSRKEQAALEREAHAQGNPDVSIDKQKKIQEERELAQLEAEKVSGEPRLVLPAFQGGERTFPERPAAVV